MMSYLIQIGIIGSSSKLSLLPSPSWAQLVSLNIFRAQAEHSSEIQNLFEPEPSQAPILTMPAQLKLFGSSQLKLKPAWYTL